MNYQTRHLEARTVFRHEGRELRPGDRFYATDVDAKYLTRYGHARDAAPQPATQAPAAAWAPVELLAREHEPMITSSFVVAEAEAMAADIDQAPTEVSSAGGHSEAPQDPVEGVEAQPGGVSMAPASRRRGRPTNAELAARAAGAGTAGT